MSIAVKTSSTARVRALKANRPQLSDEEIAKLTGGNLSMVRATLSTKGRDKPKSRVSP